MLLVFAGVVGGLIAFGLIGIFVGPVILAVADKLLAAQMPVLSWWALVTVITRASTTITVLAIFTVGIALHSRGLTTVGEIVMFVSFATMLIQKLEQEEMQRLKKSIPEFSPGDTVIVRVNVVEGDKKREQAFEGVVIARRNRGMPFDTE